MSWSVGLYIQVQLVWLYRTHQTYIRWLVRGLSDLHNVVDSSFEVWTQEILEGSCGFTWQALDIRPPGRSSYVVLRYRLESLGCGRAQGISKEGREWAAYVISSVSYSARGHWPLAAKCYVRFCWKVEGLMNICELNYINLDTRCNLGKRLLL